VLVNGPADAGAPVLADPEAPGQSLVEDGAHGPAKTSQRLACDAATVTMRHAPEGESFRFLAASSATAVAR